MTDQPAPASKTSVPAIRNVADGSALFYHFASNSILLGGKLLFRFELVNPERIPRQGAFMVAPTHASYLDPPLVGSNLPRPSYYLARETLFRVPLLGLALRHLQVQPIRRGASDREALRTCRQVLQAGWPLMFFPEGTRTRDGRIGKIQGGFALILDGLDIPYVPINMQETFRALPRGRVLPWPCKLHGYVGEPRMLPKRQEGEKSRDYMGRCAAQLEADWRALGAQ